MKLIKRIFDRNKYEADVLKFIQETYHVNSLDEYFNMLIPKFAQYNHSDYDYSIQQAKSVIDKNINYDDYYNDIKYKLLNVCIDSDGSLVYIVLDEKGTAQKLKEVEGQEFIIVE